MAHPNLYQMYRKSTLGVSLADTLDELVQRDHIPPPLSMRVLQQFDRSVCDALASKVKTKATFKGHLHTYRFCDAVWTFILENATFRIDSETIAVDKVKIVACDSHTKDTL